MDVSWLYEYFVVSQVDIELMLMIILILSVSII